MSILGVDFGFLVALFRASECFGEYQPLEFSRGKGHKDEVQLNKQNPYIEVCQEKHEG